MPKIILETNKPVAYDSPDHLRPHGTAANNSTSLLYNKKLFAYLPAPSIALLDVGCAGGGFVKSVQDAGGFAVGLEGSDYSQRNKRAEWATIPDSLFTADVTEPFQFYREESDSRAPLKFNVITAWEVFEHIAEDKLAAMFVNFEKHLAPGGIVMASIADWDDPEELHQTVHSRDWWIAELAKFGFRDEPVIVDYFYEDWVRGPATGDASFHVALLRTGDPTPQLPKLQSLAGSARISNVVRRFQRRARNRIRRILGR